MHISGRQPLEASFVLFCCAAICPLLLHQISSLRPFVRLFLAIHISILIYLYLCNQKGHR